MWKKFPDEKPRDGQICIVAAGPDSVVQVIALMWDAHERKFFWIEEEDFDAFPTNSATHWMPWPDSPRKEE